MTTSISGSSSNPSSSSSTSSTATNGVTGGPDTIGYTNSQSGSHVFGLASGVDVDSMVKKMMDAASMPLIQMEQQKQILEWQQTDYRSMNSALLDLKNQTFSMSLQNNYLSRQANSSQPSLLSATASSAAPKASYSITSGTMATAATITSAGIQKSSTATAIDPTQSLWVNRDRLANFTYTTTSVTSPESVTINSSGKTGNLNHTLIVDDPSATALTATDASGKSISFNSSNIYFDQASYDKDTTSTNKVLIDPNTGALTFNNSVSNVQATSYSYGKVTSDMSANIQTPDSHGVLQDHKLTINPSQSINDIMTSINSSSAGVTAFYGNGNQVVSLTSNKTGNLYTGTQNSGSDIQVSGGLLTTVLGLGLSSAKVTDGTDASLMVNGAQVTSHSNSFTVNNVTFNLNGNITSSSPVSVNVSDDTSQIYNSIKSWVDKYNSTIATINSKLSEKRDRSYQPLTNVQMSQMNQTQIDQWTTKAKSGMLANDNILHSGLSQMRQDLYSPVTVNSSETFTQLTQIGITTSANYQDNGKLVIDDSKLKAAIAQDPQSVMDLFTNKNDSYSSQGIMTRLNNTLTNTVNQVTQKAGTDTSVYNQYDLGIQLHDFDTRISDFQTKLDDLQKRYYNQFSAMETAINSSNQQAAYIQNNMG